MRKLMTATAILIVPILIGLGAPAAMAQSGSGKNGSANSSNGTGVPAAPVGHRQPRTGDVPSEKNVDKLDAEDAALDKKIKSICRGC
jgi:hypothetical protein